MSYRERQRLADIQAAIDAIRSHLQRGDLSDGQCCIGRSQRAGDWLGEVVGEVLRLLASGSRGR
jgi:hypothetical protein